MMARDGVPEVAARHAIYNTAGDGIEAAFNWFYSNIDNPVIQTPLLVPNPNLRKEKTKPRDGAAAATNETGMRMLKSGELESMVGSEIYNHRGGGDQEQEDVTRNHNIQQRRDSFEVIECESASLVANGGDEGQLFNPQDEEVVAAVEEYKQPAQQQNQQQLINPY